MLTWHLPIVIHPFNAPSQEQHANEGGTRAEKWITSTSEWKDWYPSFFKFSGASKTPGTIFYCPYFGKANKPKDKGDLKDSYTNFVTPDDGVTMQVKIEGATSNAIARICPTSILGADFFNWVDPIRKCFFFYPSLRGGGL